MSTNRALTAVLALGCTALAAGWCSAASLDRSLIATAGEVLDALAREKVRTVGALPFKVKKGSRASALATAPLSTNLPGRLENALIVVQGSDKTAIQVIRDAAGTAARGSASGWSTSRAAFNKLFTLEYQPAWGAGKVKADAFLTGEVIHSSDNREATRVVFHLLKPGAWKDGRPAVEEVATFQCSTDRPLLRDLGYAFVLPRSMVARKGVTSRALDRQALKQLDDEEDGKRPQPAQGSASARDVAGMRIEIEYDGKRQPISDLVGGKGQKHPLYQVPAARAGQEVVIYLTRIAAEDAKIGVVLRVNGLSTLEMQDGPPESCTRWIYDPWKKGKREGYSGFYFQKGGGLEERKFQVLTAEESVGLTGEMGSRAGWIDLDVFVAGEPGGDPRDDPDGLTISTRGAVKARGATLKEVREKIARANNLKLLKPKVTARGGLIVLGTATANPQPYQSSDLPNARAAGGISIRYYEKAASSPKGGN
jgi:hypothetical protein